MYLKQPFQYTKPFGLSHALSDNVSNDVYFLLMIALSWNISQLSKGDSEESEEHYPGDWGYDRLGELMQITGFFSFYQLCFFGFFAWSFLKFQAIVISVNHDTVKTPLRFFLIFFAQFKTLLITKNTAKNVTDLESSLLNRCLKL